MAFSSDDEPTVLPAPSHRAHDAAGDGPRLSDGQIIGPYRIERLLGRGGMGEVYEAEHLEHRRRVALKVLTQRLAGADDRARFLREGQLSASLNHPNTVYVFGSEEIGGSPVIAMELVAGGTLKDVVDRGGPMAPAAAVDAILQVVAGLDAALVRGILHRDVKPSNCFVEPDGTVKVGDFGLSIPVSAPEVTQPGEMGTFQGTPQFAAPEQLRGRKLDVRADIYAVGATLYYLLSGRPPFEDRDLLGLLTKVATDVPAAPGRPGVAIPPGLSALVLGCLAKDPAARPASYAELEAGLRPFSSAVPVPANLGLRVAAGLIDWLLLWVLMAPLAVAPVLELAGNDAINASIKYSSPRALNRPLWITLLAGALTILYYGLLEGRWGRSLGKQVCGLEVATASGEPAGYGKAMRRALVFALPYWIAVVPKLIAVSARGPGALPAGPWDEALYWGGDLLLLLMFSSMRPRNGFGAWHDLASGTRVVTSSRRSRREPIDAAATPDPSPAGTSAARALGPYAVIGSVGPTAGGGVVLLGFDRALKRQVWIHGLPPGAPAVGAARARLGRAGRLRWVNGRRAEDEAWDAYEAPDGEALVRVSAVPRSWRAVQHWMADLAQELAAASADGSMPPLALDRVWITRAGQARLLDFPAPGVADGAVPGSGEVIADPQRFLARAMAHALGAGGAGWPGPEALPHGPLPRLAQGTLDALERTGFPSLASVAERAAALTAGADHVSRPRRAASILLANVPLFCALIALSIGLPTAVRLLSTEFLEMSRALVEIRTLDGKTDPESVKAREGLELYLADRYRPALSDERTWLDPRAAGLLTPLRPIADRILAGRFTASDDERRAALAAAAARLGNPVSIRRQAAGIATLLPAIVLLGSAIAAVLSAFFSRGGLLLRLLGLAVVTVHGGDVSRVRAAVRALAAWSPVLLAWIFAWGAARGGRDLFEAFSGWWMVPAAAAAVAIAGCLWAISHPARGVAERLSGTALVPR